jgi:hypothetical protein
MPLQQTSGNATADAFGGGVAVAPKYVEDVFSTYLYTGTGATQTITNGLDLAGKGGMVWGKCRSAITDGHRLYNSLAGWTNRLQTDTTGAQVDETTAAMIQSVSSTGFAMGATSYMNDIAKTYVSWSFAQANKFFKVAQATVSGGVSATVDLSSLGTVGMVAVKRTDSTSAWFVFHRSCTSGNLVYLNTIAAETTDGSVTLSGTTLSLVGGTIANGTYIVYAWAHDTSATGLIQCGRFTTDGSGNATVALGWEPQLAIPKKISTTGQWLIMDSARGFGNNSVANTLYLVPNASDADAGPSAVYGVSATGLVYTGLAPSATYIYLAIRRGPMKLPTVGTQVYNAIAHTGTGSTTAVTGVNFPLDFAIARRRDLAGAAFNAQSRMQGGGVYLDTNATAAEATDAGARIIGFDSMSGFTVGGSAPLNTSGQAIIFECFRRYPGVFDEVCYQSNTTGAQNISHNLTVSPEMMIVKQRNSIKDWTVYFGDNTKYIVLNTTAASATVSTMWNNTSPTAAVFTVGTNSNVNDQGGTGLYVAYLFATLAGVSKVGSYTGNGTTQAIACGFAGGARFVLIKRTDATGDWYTFDTARGMTLLTDPYLLLNSTAAETATLGSVTSTTGGFTVNAAILAAINTSGGSYIFLSVA